MPFTTLCKNIDFEKVAFTSFYLLTIDKISLNQIKKIKLHNIKLEKLSFIFLRNMQVYVTLIKLVLVYKAKSDHETLV